MTFSRVILTWLLLAGLMTANGALREMVLKAWFSVGFAELLSALAGLALILGVTYVAFRTPVGSELGPVITASIVLVVLTVSFETVLGRVEGRTWSELAANYRFWEGRYWPLLLLALAASPFLARGKA